MVRLQRSQAGGGGTAAQSAGERSARLRGQRTAGFAALGGNSTRLRACASRARLFMNARRSEIRENGSIEIDDQALEKGLSQAKEPSRVNGASHGADWRFLSCQQARRRADLDLSYSSRRGPADVSRAPGATIDSVGDGSLLGLWSRTARHGLPPRPNWPNRAAWSRYPGRSSAPGSRASSRAAGHERAGIGPGSIRQL